MELSSLIQSLKPTKGVISRLHFEAYCDDNGYLDAPYLNHVIEGRKFTQAGLNSQVNTAFGAATFLPNQEEELEYVTYDEFKEFYEFALYPVVRDYIMVMYEITGKLLTRQNLFAWTLEDSKERKL